MEQLLERFGLLAIFAGTAVEGDVTMVLGGVIAHLGYVTLSGAIVAGAIGQLVNDFIWFSVGRRGSASVLKSRTYQRVGPTIERWRDRVGFWQILLSHFIYGTRAATMAFWGIHGLPLRRLLLIDVPSCAIWAITLGALGYGASGSTEVLLGEVKRTEMWLLVAALVTASVAFLVRKLTIKS